MPLSTRQIQTILADAGYYSGAIDGAAGPITDSAVRSFQQASGLIPDGAVGPKTEAALSSALAVQRPPAAPGSLVFPTYADLLRIFPGANAVILQGFAAALPKVIAGCGVNKPSRLWHFIGQCGHESNHFKTRQEYASGEAYEGRRDLGNVSAGDGPKFRGHGEIQCTGRANHALATMYVRKALADPTIDLVADPQAIVRRADISVAVDCWYWTKGSRFYGDLNLVADHDASTDAEPGPSFDPTVETITRAINGGVSGLASRRQLTRAVRALVLSLNRA